MSNEEALPTPVRDALDRVRQHPSVSEATVTTTTGGIIVVTAQFQVPLGSRWQAEGQSPSGVRPLEPVQLFFPADYPTRAPAIRLRADFNRTLPHINPHQEGRPVPPCVVFGDTTEIFHREGLGFLLDQTARWLDNAAQETLIDPSQGWEAVRRDEADDRLVFDPEEIRGLFRRRTGYEYLSTVVLTLVDRADPGLAFGTTVTSTTVSQETIGERFGGKIDDGVFIGRTLSIVCWPGPQAAGGPLVCNQYLPETVSTLADLIDRAAAYGCAQPLRDALSWLTHSALGQTSGRKIPLFIILAVHRPWPVIGTTSPIELLAYRCDVGFPKLLGKPEDVPVQPVSHAYPVSVPLLRRMSGIADDIVPPGVTVLGCGSLGSKVSTHLGRAALTPRMLVDKGLFRPHNVARHALLPGGPLEPIIALSKAAALAKSLGGLPGGAPLHHDGNVLAVTPRSPAFNPIFGSALLINTTAAHGVRDHLSVLGDAVQARVAEGALADSGRLGILSLEGPRRNPDTSDLAATAYEILRKQGELAALSSLNNPSRSVAVGLGCGSETLVMTDSRISQHAAAMGTRIMDWLTGGLPQTGTLSIGRLSGDGMSLAWQHSEVGPTMEIPAENDRTWTIRVLAAADSAIRAETDKFTAVETGGVIVGRVSPTRRVIYVTGVIDAPIDSRRSAGAFVLGVAGLSQTLEIYNRSAAGTLWCLGTWHSHLANQGGSPTDYRTAVQLEGQTRGAMAMLIRRPGGYSAIVKPGF